MPDILTPAETLDRAITRLRAAASAAVTHSGGCTVPPMAVCAQADLTAALDELERLRAQAATAPVSGCTHGPDRQCIECVPDDGFSFRFQPLGGSEGGA